MNKHIEKRAQAMLRKHLFNSRWKRAAQVLACVAVFCTTYMLILPAITRTAPTFCGHEEHVHADGCYTTSLVCGIEEGEAEMVMVSEGHVHTEACFEEVRELICGQEEGMAVQTAAAGGGNVNEEAESEDGGETAEAAAIETVEAHVHTEACYETVMRQVCGQEESEPVYEAVGGHTHTEACYHTELTCQAAEHIHGEQCYSDPSADLESAVSWEQTLPAFEEYTGNWTEDVLTIAKSQLGYTESSRNFLWENGYRKGYTRYGAMQGIPYGDWCAMYLQFCLHYAGVDRQMFPSSPSCMTWARMSAENENYYLPWEYTPEVGDIVFFDYNNEGVTHHIGLITELSWGQELDHETAQTVDVVNGFTTIEGNASNTVKYCSYRLDDPAIFGYTRIPENPNPPMAEEFALDLPDEEVPAADPAAEEEPAEEENADAEETADESEEETAAADAASDLEEENAEAEETAEEENANEEAAEAEEEENADEEAAEAEEEENADAEDAPAGPVELASITETGVEIHFSAPRSAFAEDVDFDGLWLLVEEIDETHEDYAAYANAAADAVAGEFKEVQSARFFDITVMNAAREEVKLTNEALATVVITFPEKVETAAEENDLSVIHFGEEGTEILETEHADEVVAFETPSFSVFGVVETSVITSRIITAEGKTFIVNVTYTAEANIPEGATLSLTEYHENSWEYGYIKDLHQPIEVIAGLSDAEINERIDAEVTRLLEEQEAFIQSHILNEDLTEADFIRKTESELRAEVAAVYEPLRETRRNFEKEDSLSLVDITILDAQGSEVEPAAPVSVEIIMEELPQDTTWKDIKNTLQVEHYVEKSGELSSEIVVSTDGEKGAVQVTEDDVTKVVFDTESFSFYTLAWNQHDDTLDLDVMRTVVYYGFMISGKFREFGPMSWVKPHYAEENTTGGSNTLLDGKHHVYELDKDSWVTGVAAYSAYRFDKAVVQQDGYNGGKRFEIANERTYTKADGTQVTYTGPVIIGNETDGYTVLLKDGSTYKLGNADQIQVLYDSPYGEGMDYNYAKTSTTDKPVHGGDTYGLNEDGDPEGLGVPEHTKTLSENQSSGRNDNTYRLSLTATGRKKETKDNTKADIILITDYSGSMGKNPIINGTYNTNGSGMLQQAVDEGLLPPLKELDERFGKGTVEISHISFGTMASIPARNVPATDFGIWAVGSGATNYEDALNKLGQIKTRADATTYVIFITDGNPTVRNSKGEINQWDGESWLYAHGYCSDEYFWTFRDNKWQWVRVGDIEKDHSLNWYNNGYYYGSGNEATGSMRDCYNVTIPYVQQLVQNNVNLSVIATKTGATYASQMVDVGNAAKAGSSSYYYAGDTQTLKDAFSDILSAMEEELSYKFVSIDDEMSAVAETTLVETPEDFEYFKYPSHIKFVNNMTDKTPDTHTNALAVDEDGNALDEDGNKCSESGKTQAARADFRWADAPAAVYTPATDGEKGVVSWPLNTVEVQNETYEITFTVYPNQRGWDLVTTLKNHKDDPDFDWHDVSAERVDNADGSVDIYEVVRDEATNTYQRSGKKLLTADSAGNVMVSSNDNATLTYMTVEHTTTEVDGVTTETTTEEGPFTATYVNPFMSVQPSDFKIRKIWKDTLVPRWPIETVELEIWHVSKGNGAAVTVDGKTMYADADTGDLTDKSQVAFVDDKGTTWYWSAFDENLTLSQTKDLKGYINIHEPDENLGDANGYGASRVTKDSFDYMMNNGMIDDENYRINASGERLRNANGNLIQYFPYWEREKYIAPGLIATSISPNPLSGAKGHFFALREKDTNTDFIQHFELETDLVRPMMTDGVMKPDTRNLKGMNSRKGELAITKMVLTQDRHEIRPDVPFQVTVELTDKQGNALMQDEGTGTDPVTNLPIITQKPRTDIEYVVYDAEGNVVDIDSITGSKPGDYTIGVTYTQIDAGAASKEFHKGLPYDASLGKHRLVFDKLYPDWTLVLVNLPSNAKWTVQETHNENAAVSNGYTFEGYAFPDGQRGHDTLHPQPEFHAERTHYSQGTIRYNQDDGTIIETDLVKVTNFEDVTDIRDASGQKIAAADGSAANAVSGFIALDMEELVDIHNIRIADERVELKKIRSDTNVETETNMFDPASVRMFAIKPSGGNPSSFSGTTLYEKEGSGYKPTTDTQVDSQKTYYVALEPIEQSTSTDASVNPKANGWIRHYDLFGKSYPDEPVIKRNDIPVTSHTKKEANTQYYGLAQYADYVGTKIDDAATPGFGNVRFSLFRDQPEQNGVTSKWYYNANVTEPKNYKNVLNPKKDVLKPAEYENLKAGTLGIVTVTEDETNETYTYTYTGQTLDADGYLVDAQGARVQHDGKDVLFIPNYFSTGGEDGRQNLVPAVNKAGTVLLGQSTDANGRIDFGELEPGTYWLIEQTPAGFLTPRPTKIEVTLNGVRYSNSAQNSGLTVDAHKRTETVQEDNRSTRVTTYEILLTNTPKDLRLPETGGLGTNRYILAGSLILMTGILSLVYISNKKRSLQRSRHRRRKEGR